MVKSLATEIYGKLNNDIIDKFRTASQQSFQEQLEADIRKVGEIHPEEKYDLILEYENCKLQDARRMAKIDRDRIAHIAKHAPERHPEPRPEYAPSESAELARHRLETEWYERSGKYMLEEYQDASKDAWNRLREAVDLAMQREAGQKPTEHELSLRQIRIADGRESETGEEPKRTALNREIMAEFPRPGSSGEQESAGQSREVVSTNDRGEGSER